METTMMWIRRGAPVPAPVVDTMSTAEEFEGACWMLIEEEIEAGRRLMMAEWERVA